MNEEELNNMVLEAQLMKNSCKILTDGKGNVKSIETKVYHKEGSEAVEQAVIMQVQALKQLKAEEFVIGK